MQKLKQRFPQYKDMDDVTLMNSVAKKYPVYKPLALEVGDRIRKSRAEQLAFEQQPGAKASAISTATRTAMRTSGLNEYRTSAHIMANKERIPQPEPGENFFQYHKRFKKALALEQREEKEAAPGVVHQFDDAMSAGVAAGMLTHPAGTMKMVGLFMGGEKALDALGINEKLASIPNLDVRDTVELLKFGVMGLIAGGLTKWSSKRAAAKIEAKAKTNKSTPEAVKVAKKMVVDLEAAAKVGERMRAKKPKAFTQQHEMSLGEALAAADKAGKAIKPKPKAKAKAKPSINKQLTDALIVPELKAPTKGKAIVVESFGKKSMVPLVETYKGKHIVKTGKNYSVWDAKKKTLFEVALDDSKVGSNKRRIDPKMNSVEGAKKYIDWITGAEKKAKPISSKVELAKEAIAPKKKGAIVDIKDAKTGDRTSEGIVVQKKWIAEGKEHVRVQDPVTKKIKTISTAVEQKSVSPKEVRLEKIKAIAEQRKASKPKTTKPQDQVASAESDMIDVTVRVGGKDTTKKMTSKQLFNLKESIREGAEVKIIDKAQTKAEAKASKLEAAADKILGKRTPKDQIKDVGDVLGGLKPKGLGSNLGNVKLDAKGTAAMNRLTKDAKKSGKDLGKYLKENLKLNEATAGVIIRAVEAQKLQTAKVKLTASKKASLGELDKLPAAERDLIIQEKLRNAKSPQHERNIKKKYGIKSETPTSDPAKVKDIPELDPLMDKNTLFNPKDKASIKMNDKINANLDKAKAIADKKQLTKKEYTPHVNKFIDTTHALQGVQERTGAPVYSKVYLPGVETANIKEARVNKIMTRFTKALKGGLHTEEGDSRIVKWITKREGKLDAHEQSTANSLMEITRELQPMVKYLRMRKWAEGVEKIPKGMKKLVMQGRKVLKNEGVGALEKWVVDKDFGVIKNDRYVPAEVLRGLRIDKHRRSAYETLNPHIKSRVAEEQIYDNTIPLAQRLHSYLERVLGDYHFYDYLKDTKKVMDPLKLAYKDQISMETWLGTLQGHGLPGIGMYGRAARMARGQFFKTVLFDPSKWVRNLLQNPAFLYQNYSLGTNIKKTAIMTRRKTSALEKDYFSTHVSQLGALGKEYMYLYETKQTGKLGKLDRAATKMAEAYTKTDEFNRWWSFKHALAGIEGDMAKYKAGKINWDVFAKRQGLGSFTDLEVKHIMGLKPEQAKLQIARLITERTHVRYKKFERGLGALSELGEVATSLQQFPKTVLSRYIDSVRMIAKGRSWSEQKQGFNLLAGYIVMPIIANEMLKKITGEKAYFDSDLHREVEYEPYGFLQSVAGFSFGGAQVNQTAEFFDAVKYMTEIAYQSTHGGYKGTKGKKKLLSTIRSITKIADRLGESYIPFLRKALDGVESMTDKQTYKLLTTSFDELTKRKSALRRNKAERDLADKIKHFFFGTEREGGKNESAFDKL